MISFIKLLSLISFKQLPSHFSLYSYFLIVNHPVLETGLTAGEWRTLRYLSNFG
jgi:hypothetical protein